jgi:hypothetical protein
MGPPIAFTLVQQAVLAGFGNALCELPSRHRQADV